MLIAFIQTCNLESHLQRKLQETTRQISHSSLFLALLPLALILCRPRWGTGSLQSGRLNHTVNRVTLHWLCQVRHSGIVRPTDHKPGRLIPTGRQAPTQPHACTFPIPQQDEGENLKDKREKEQTHTTDKKNPNPHMMQRSLLTTIRPILSKPLSSSYFS